MTINNETIAIQFFRGESEKDQPEIRLFRNLDGKTGHAVYKFLKPKTITLKNCKSIQKMYLIDEEGEISTRKIDLFISDNNIKEVKSIYNWNTTKEFERFMRFATRHASYLTNN